MQRTHLGPECLVTLNAPGLGPPGPERLPRPPAVSSGPGPSAAGHREREALGLEPHCHHWTPRRLPGSFGILKTSSSFTDLPCRKQISFHRSCFLLSVHQSARLFSVLSTMLGVWRTQSNIKNGSCLSGAYNVLGRAEEAAGNAEKMMMVSCWQGTVFQRSLVARRSPP